MATHTSFGTLVDVPLREAWAHEAHRFTPWLAENLDRLSAVIGIPLELSGIEAPVGSFSADILARNAADDSVVLIENQLEGSDHKHLGQIMTYLAGLETHTMIWVAPNFRDEHLSAIRWLNEHTVDPFAFFAIRLRAVRIGDSPLAPLFEVLERPNNWDRRLSEKKRTIEVGRSELGEHRLAFWTHFLERHPIYGSPHAASSHWAALPCTDAVVVQYIAKQGVGVFVRPPRGGSMEDVGSELAPWLDQLSVALGAPKGGQTSFLSQSLDIDASDHANWSQMADWLDERTRAYQMIFASLLGNPPQTA